MLPRGFCKNRKLFALSLNASLLMLSSISTAGPPPGAVSFSDPLDRIALQNGAEKRLDVGIGSGACRLATDPEGIIYTITDRGPNISTTDAQKLLGQDFGEKKGGIFPSPNFVPTIYKLQVQGGQVRVWGCGPVRRAVSPPGELGGQAAGSPGCCCG